MKKNRNIIKILSLCMLFVVFAFFVCGCSLLTKKDYMIAYDIEKDPVNLDPQTAFDKSSLIVIENVFEGLFTLGENGEILNAIAESYELSGNIYTFALRDDAFWENGEKVTAQDFVFGFKRLLTPDTNSQGAKQFYSIENAKAVHDGVLPPSSLGVKALTDYSLQIQLEDKNENFLFLLTSTYASPCNEKFFLESKGKYGLEAVKILANGPFNIYSWRHDYSVKLKKSKTYYDSKNVLPSDVNLYINTPSKTAERLLSNTIDAAFVGHKDIEPFLEKGFNTESIENSTWGILFNCENETLANSNVRKGISRCFDRNSYKDTLPPEFTVANAIVPHSIMLFDKSFRELVGENIMPAFDAKDGVALAKAGLSELGRDTFEPFNLIINADEMPLATATFSFPSQVLQRELSLFINIEELKTADYNKRLKSGDFDLAFYNVYTDDYKISSMFSKFIYDEQGNYSNYKNEKFKAEYNAAITKTDKNVVVSSYKNAELILSNDPAFIPMFYSTDYFVYGEKVRGVYYNPQTGLVNFKSAIFK